MYEFFYVCRNCAVGRTIEELRAFEPIVVVEGNATTWTCPECGATILVHLDGGTLDLGLVQPDSDNDFEIFA